MIIMPIVSHPFPKSIFLVKLFLCVSSVDCTPFASIRIQEMKQFDERIIWHLLTRVTHQFSFSFNIVVLVVLKVFIVGLLLQGRSIRVRV